MAAVFKGNDYLSSVRIQLLKIFSSETTWSLEIKLLWNGPWVISFQKLCSVIPISNQDGHNFLYVIDEMALSQNLIPPVAHLKIT
jgi:hypothetical protein